MADSSLSLIVRMCEQAFEVGAWHGPTLYGSIRTLAPEQASWRPDPDRHSIHEIVVHCAYWKYRVWKLLTGSEMRFDEPGADEEDADWFGRYELDEDRWDADVARLRSWHARLLAALRMFDDDRLQDIAYKDYTFEDVLVGIASHDLYHAGQVRLLVKLQEDA